MLARWTENDISLVIATSAFGLGVNKPNIQYVYHVGVPPSLEAWVQEAGRGGRDGDPSQGDTRLVNKLYVELNAYMCLFSTATVLYDTNFQILA